jgi:hypothetical protein
MQVKLKLIVIMGLLVLPVTATADSLTERQVIAALKRGSDLPMTGAIADQLADNLLAAQAAAPYTSFEPDSLQLSIDAVLRAISLYEFPDGPTRITSQAAEPIVWLQSTVAIDDRVSVSLTPGSIDFGSEPIVTPEPGEWILILTGLTAFVMTRGLLRRSTKVMDCGAPSY